MLPRTQLKKDAVELYNSFPGYKARMVKHGFVAVTFEPPRPGYLPIWQPKTELWEAVMQKGQSLKRPKATDGQIEIIMHNFYSHPFNKPEPWLVQVERDLTVYPLHDAIATWLDGADHLLNTKKIDLITYRRIGNIAREYAHGSMLDVKK